MLNSLLDILTHVFESKIKRYAKKNFFFCLFVYNLIQSFRLWLDSGLLDFSQLNIGR